MGATKSYEFSVKDNKLAKIAKILKQTQPTISMNFPSDYKYSKEHTWIKVSDNQEA